MYVELPVWLAALGDGERADAAAELLAAHEGELEVSLVTFLELFAVEQRYPFDRERAITAILELAEYDGDPAVLYRAAAYREDGLDPFDAVHAAIAGAPPPSSAGEGGREDDAVDRWLSLTDVGSGQTDAN